MLTTLANILLLLSALPTLILVWEPARRNPEGAVGFHLITIPVALLQVIALAFAVRGGLFDFLPGGRPLAYGMLLPYFIGMNVLPFLAVERGATGPLAKLALILVLAASFAAVNRLPARMFSTSLLAIACLCGLVLIAGQFLPYFHGIARLFAVRGSMSSFDESEIPFQAEEWAKLPDNPALWQLIQFTHSMNKEVKQKCLAKIAALPNLEQEVINILGTGWAEHALPYLVDDYPGPFAPLAPAYAAFLDAEYAAWEPTLISNPAAGTWASSLNRHFDVAEKIIKEGGDLRSPLRRWIQLFHRAPGAARFKTRLKKMIQ